MIVEEVEGDALATLVVNKRPRDAPLCTGGRLISEELGIKLETARVEDGPRDGMR